VNSRAIAKNLTDVASFGITVGMPFTVSASITFARSEGDQAKERCPHSAQSDVTGGIYHPASGLLVACRFRSMRTIGAMSRTAECACGRVRITVENEPVAVVTCHCDFCQKRTGSAFQVSALFPDAQGIAVTGETRIYNGLEINGVGTTDGDEVSYHFCATCGSTVFWTIDGRPGMAIAVGNFDDPDFPGPTVELHTLHRHYWVQPVEGAQQFEGFRPK